MNEIQKAADELSDYITGGEDALPEVTDSDPELDVSGSEVELTMAELGMYPQEVEDFAIEWITTHPKLRELTSEEWKELYDKT